MMEGSLQDSLASGGISRHYLEYMSPDTEYAHQIFTREVIRRSGRWGDSTPTHPLLEKYESVAISGLCPIFAALSLFECGSFYEDACFAALRVLGICDSKNGIDRRNHLRCIACADCVLDIAGCKLERSKGASRETRTESS